MISYLLTRQYPLKLLLDSQTKAAQLDRVNASKFLLENVKASLHEKRLLVTFCRNKNLPDLLINSSLFPPTQTKGCHPCGKPRCETCSHIMNFNTVKSTSTNQILSVATSSTCLSTNIAYLIQCARCRIQYVGQS